MVHNSSAEQNVDVREVVSCVLSGIFREMFENCALVVAISFPKLKLSRRTNVGDQIPSVLLYFDPQYISISIVFRSRCILGSSRVVVVDLYLNFSYTNSILITIICKN